MDREEPIPAAKGARIAPLLRLLAEALDTRSSSGESQEGASLVELGQLARLQIPLRGVLAVSDDQLFNAIDRVAIQHLDLTSARRTLDETLARIEPLASRDDIEVAVDQLCAVLNVAYFNAGLAFGVTFAELKSL